MYYDQPGDGALWVRGQDYKMSFGPTGATYFPRFGARQPHNVPLILSPDVVTSNGAAVAFDGAAAATRKGDRVEIDRGAFVEAYDLTPQSIEQTFVFRALPARGDLVVHIPGTCELESRTATDGLEFRNELALIKYGHAVAIDRNGSRFEVATQLVDGSIELRVDADSVGRAALPLVIDPVVATFPIDFDSTSMFDCDVAWNDTYSCWFIVYEVKYSITDHDVYARIMNVDGTTRLQDYIDFTTTNWTNPRCGALAGANQFLVVAGTNATSVGTVSGREVSAADMSKFSQFNISRPEDGSCYGAVVGGDPYPGLPSSYAVAYQRTYSSTDTDILVRRVNPDNTLVDTAPIFLSNSADTLDDQPTISKSNDSGEWMIVWHRLGGYGTFGARVEYNSVVTQAPFHITTSCPSPGFPSVSSPMTGTHEYLVACQTHLSSDADVWLVLVNGTTTVSEMNLSEAENFNPDLNQDTPSVDCDGTHFAVAYREQYSSTDTDVYVSEVGLSGGALALFQGHRNLAFSGSIERAPAIASYHSSGGTSPSLARRYVVAWEDFAGVDGNIEGGMFNGQDGGSLIAMCFGDSANLCPCGNSGSYHHGCASSINPNGALLRASGTASVSLDDVLLQCSGTSNGPCLYFQGTSLAVSPFGDGLRCVGGSIRRLGTPVSVGGNSQFPSSGGSPVSVSGLIPSSGATRFYQAWYRNSASFCTPSTFNTSNAVQIIWAP